MNHKIRFSVLFVLCIVVFATVAQAQKTKTPSVWQQNHYISLGGGFGGNIFNVNVSWAHLIPIAWKNRIKLGYGIRIDNYYTYDVHFVPALNVRKNNVPVDMIVASPHITSFNLNFNFEIAALNWLDVGLNVDLIGGSLGKPQNILIVDEFNTIHQVTLTPERFNLFLFGKNDKGTLNSEFYLRFWLPGSFSICAGLSVIHIIQDVTGGYANYDRYFKDPKSGFLKFTWTPYRSKIRTK